MKLEKPDKVPPQEGASVMGKDAPASGNMSNHKSGPKPVSASEKNWKQDKVPPAAGGWDM